MSEGWPSVAPPDPAPAPPALTPDPDRYGAAMAPRFGPLFHLLGLGHALGRTRLEDPGAETIREAARQGPVVYVLPRVSALDHLALNAALASRGLPLSSWAPRLRTALWHPLPDAWQGFRYRAGEVLAGRFAPDPVDSGWLVRALATGHAVTWFVDDRTRLLRREPMPFDPLVGAAELDPPVRVVPLMVVWDRSPEPYDPLRRFFLSKRGVPGLLRRLWAAVRSADAFVQVGRPLELRELRDRVGAERLPGVLRRVLARALRDERRLATGPRLMPHRTMKRLVLHNPPMRELARREAELTGTRVERIERRLSSDYDRMAANFSWTMIQLLHLVLRPLWTRVFSGVDVRPEDVERIRAGLRDGAVVLVPSHKSHFDYVLMSWVMYEHDLIVPHVVAGMNLAVWPLGTILRGAGGFFLKRTFAGDRLFPAVFARYLRELLLQDYPVEFFIEGGRTRSGRLMRPRFGVLGMVLDAAALRAHGREVTLLPVNLAYEQVAEETAYARELGGEAKRPESFWELLRARRVLSRRFGRVYLRVAEPIPCGPVVDAREGAPPWDERPEAERRSEVEALGYRVIGAVGEQAVLLPTSLVAVALLALPQRAVRHAELQERILRFDARFRELGVLRAASLERFDQAVAQALDRFVRDGRLEALTHEGERLWGIVPEERITLDYYKNQVVHFLAPAGLVACALRGALQASGADGVPEAELEAAYARLAALLRRDVVLDPAVPASARVAEGLALLERAGAVNRAAAHVTLADSDRAGELYGLFRPLLEGYLAVLDATAAPGTRDRWVAAVQEQVPALVDAGRLTRPEAASLVTLQNAVATLRDEGALVEQAARRRVALPGARAEPELAQDSVRAAEIRAWLQPMVTAPPESPA
ncbi:MAG: 1-acyl-sn-glycerol-3-phosphate acyltransferase [Myxococcota bacterium]